MVQKRGGMNDTGKAPGPFYHIAQGAGVPIVLVRFDFGRKVIGVGPTFELSGDLTADLAQLQALYADVKGKYPQRVE